MTTLARRPVLPAPTFHGVPLAFGDVVTARNPFGLLTTFAVRVWGTSPRGRWVAGDCMRTVWAEHICCVERDGHRL